MIAEFNRRFFLTGAALAMLDLPAVADAGPFAIAEWTTPEHFGATGDGVADDGPALVRLSHWLNSRLNSGLNSGAGRGVTLRGRYRVGRRQTSLFSITMGMEGAITLLNPDHVALVFQGGALLIDNLDAAGRGDQLHGICTRGPGSHVWLSEPRIEWVTKPAARGQGDGIRFYGYPSDHTRGAAGDGKLEFIWVDRSAVKWAPQTGMIFSGCSDIVITSHAAFETFADGCHFNACRRITAGHIESTNCRDDTCAFVTYHNDDTVEGDIVGISAYSQPGVGEWNNSGSRVESVHCEVSCSSGLRFAGALDVHVGSVTASQALQAAVIDAAVAGGNYRWTYFQSRKCSIGSIVADECALGLVARSENNAYAAGDTPETADVTDERYSKMDVSVGSLVANSCEGWGMMVQDIEGLKVANARVSGSAFLIEHVNNAAFGEVTVENCLPLSQINHSGSELAVVVGTLTALNAKIVVHRARYLEVKNSAGDITYLSE
jgi:hypothetical protein